MCFTDRQAWEGLTGRPKGHPGNPGYPEGLRVQSQEEQEESSRGRTVPLP